MKLEAGEMICDKCNGTGYYIEDETSLKHLWCPKCHGAKKVDWISNAIWKKEECHYIKPGVYTQEVDLSAYIPSGNLVKTFEIKNINQKGE